MVDLEPEIWVPVPRTWFEGGASFINITTVFGFQWTKSFWNRIRKRPDVGAGAVKLKMPVSNLSSGPTALVTATLRLLGCVWG